MEKVTIRAALEGGGGYVVAERRIYSNRQIVGGKYYTYQPCRLLHMMVYPITDHSVIDAFCF